MNLANLWEAVADELGDQAALIHGDLQRSWAELEQRAARLAGHLDRAGIGADSKVALYLFNGPEYVESSFAAFKRRAVPVNVNYRYLAGELEYLLENSDAEAVVVSFELLERLEEVRARLPRIRTVVVVDANRATQNHGTPPDLLKCEMAAVGYRLVVMRDMPSAGGYLATFRADGPRPEPRAIRACRNRGLPTPGATATPATKTGHKQL